MPHRDSDQRRQTNAAMQLAADCRRDREELVIQRDQANGALAELKIEMARADDDRRVAEADLGPVRYLAADRSGRPGRPSVFHPGGLDPSRPSRSAVTAHGDAVLTTALCTVVVAMWRGVICTPMEDDMDEDTGDTLPLDEAIASFLGALKQGDPDELYEAMTDTAASLRLVLEHIAT
jgi:hypothetical protein